MKIQFTKNIQFTKLVKADGRLREFNFRKINSTDEGRFTVDVSDDRGNRMIFNMRKDNNGWKIVTGENVAEWIIQNETTLGGLIEEELQKD